MLGIEIFYFDCEVYQVAHMNCIQSCHNETEMIPGYISIIKIKKNVFLSIGFEICLEDMTSKNFAVSCTNRKVAILKFLVHKLWGIIGSFI